MFTGIITAQGQLTHRERLGADRQLSVATPAGFTKGIRVGDSIAVNGVCLTVTARRLRQLQFVLSPETLAKTTLGEKPIGTLLNLEKALRFGATLDGHLVAGHVDGVGTLRLLKKVSHSWHVEFAAPKALHKFLAVKGSITVDGVSLTINKLTRHGFTVMLIPHTQQATNFSALRVRQRVHLEVDLLARYVERLLRQRR